MQAPVANSRCSFQFLSQSPEGRVRKPNELDCVDWVRITAVFLAALAITAGFICHYVYGCPNEINYSLWIGGFSVVLFTLVSFALECVEMKNKAAKAARRASEEELPGPELEGETSLSSPIGGGTEGATSRTHSRVGEITPTGSGSAPSSTHSSPSSQQRQIEREVVGEVEDGEGDGEGEVEEDREGLAHSQLDATPNSVQLAASDVISRSGELGSGILVEQPKPEGQSIVPPTEKNHEA